MERRDYYGRGKRSLSSKPRICAGELQTPRAEPQFIPFAALVRSFTGTVPIFAATPRKWDCPQRPVNGYIAIGRENG